MPDGFQVTVRASGDVIGAIERPGYPFLLDGQWHPEGTAHHDGAAHELFSDLVRAVNKKERLGLDKRETTDGRGSQIAKDL